MHSYAQPGTFSAAALLCLAAALHTAAHRLRSAAKRLDRQTLPGRPWQETPLEESAPRSERAIDVEMAHAADSIAHLDVHALKDIGAPGWLIARASERRDTEHLRWLGHDHG